MITNEFKRELGAHAARASLPVGVTSGSVLGIPLAEWVYVVTILYTVLQIGVLVYKWFKKD